jgi:nicotinamidase-related amidase
MQRYFTEPTHAFARVAASLIEDGADPYFSRVQQAVIPNVRSLLAAFRQDARPVFFTEFGSCRSDGGDMPSWARRLNEYSRAAFGEAMFPLFVDSGARVDERLGPLPNEPVLRKTTSGAVASSPLEQNLRARGITHVVITGVVTAFCVSQTARELADRDFDVAIVGDACASFTEAGHTEALKAFGGAYGWVLSAEEILDAVAANGG